MEQLGWAEIRWKQESGLGLPVPRLDFTTEGSACPCALN